jgi:hypothetical protein
MTERVLESPEANERRKPSKHILFQDKINIVQDAGAGWSKLVPVENGEDRMVWKAGLVRWCI